MNSKLSLQVFLWFLVSLTFSQNHFTFNSITGDNMIVGIPDTVNSSVNDMAMEVGDEIGVFSPAGLCVGAVVWTGESVAIAVWGNNTLTTPIDGMQAGESLIYKVWDKSKDLEMDAEVSYSSGDSLYATNGISVLSSIHAMSPTNSQDRTIHWEDSHAGISLFIKGEELIFGSLIENYKRWSVYNLKGNLLALGDIKNKTAFWNRRDLKGDVIKPGTYILEAEGKTAQHTAVFLLK